MGKLIDTSKINKLAQELDKRVKELIEISETKVTTKIDSGLTKLETMIGGRYIVYIKQSEYNLLTEEERLDETKYYIITDAEDLSHEHANKDFLDSLEEGNIDASSINGYKLWVGTSEELSTITTKDPKTIYYIMDDIEGSEETASSITILNANNGNLTLTDDDYQLTTIDSNVTVNFPAVEDFIKMHLYCKSTNNVTMTFSNCKWIVNESSNNSNVYYDESNENLIIGGSSNTSQNGVIQLEADKSYEIIVVYNTIEWMVKCIVYS